MAKCKALTGSAVKGLNFVEAAEQVGLAWFETAYSRQLFGGLGQIAIWGHISVKIGKNRSSGTTCARVFTICDYNIRDHTSPTGSD